MNENRVYKGCMENIEEQEDRNRNNKNNSGNSEKKYCIRILNKKTHSNQSCSQL